MRNSLWVLLPTLALSLLPSACTQQTEGEAPYLPSPAVEISYEDGSPQRSADEVRDFARHFLQRMQPQGRSLDAELSLRLQPILRPRTQRARGARFSDSLAHNTIDTALYVVTPSNGDGSLIVSGDRRIPPVLAYVPHGKIDVNDPNMPPMLKWILTELKANADVFFIEPDSSPYFVSQTHACGQRPPRDPRRPDNGHGPKPPMLSGSCNSPDADQGSRVTTRTEYRLYEPRSEIIGPLVPVLWKQSEPYNNLSPTVNGVKAAAGCTATAIAQLCAYYKYPTTREHYFDFTPDWDFLTQKPYADKYPESERGKYGEQVSKILYKIGCDLGNQWAVDNEGSTSASDLEVPKVLRSMGFSCPSRFSDFNQEAILTNLRKGQPVLISGKTSEDTNIGHEFLCDGFIMDTYQIHRSYFGIGPDDWRYKHPDEYFYTYLLHLNWGWGIGYDSTLQDVYLSFFTPRDIGGTRRPTPAPSCNYKYNLRMLPDIQPK